jgi:hypothetical protein
MTIDDFEGLHRMQITGFRTYDEALQYARMLYKYEPVTRLIKKARGITISEANLPLLGTNFSYKDYDKFFDKNYSPLKPSTQQLLTEPAEIEYEPPVEQPAQTEDEDGIYGNGEDSSTTIDEGTEVAMPENEQPATEGIVIENTEPVQPATEGTVIENVEPTQPATEETVVPETNVPVIDETETVIEETGTVIEETAEPAPAETETVIEEVQPTVVETPQQQQPATTAQPQQVPQQAEEPQQQEKPQQQEEPQQPEEPQQTETDEDVFYFDDFGDTPATPQNNNNNKNNDINLEDEYYDLDGF